MKNRNILSAAILLLLGCSGLSCIMRAATQNVDAVNNTAVPIPIIGTVQGADNPAVQAVQLTANVSILRRTAVSGSLVQLSPLEKSLLLSSRR
jgi:Asp/Glu/hydantoin racemase